MARLLSMVEMMSAEHIRTPLISGDPWRAEHDDRCPLTAGGTHKARCSRNAHRVEMAGHALSPNSADTRRRLVSFPPDSARANSSRGATARINHVVGWRDDGRVPSCTEAAAW